MYSDAYEVDLSIDITCLVNVLPRGFEKLFLTV